MNSLTLAFTVAWVGATLYVGWMGLQQRKLNTRLRALESRNNAAEGSKPLSKAA